MLNGEPTLLLHSPFNIQHSTFNIQHSTRFNRPATTPVPPRHLSPLIRRSAAPSPPLFGGEKDCLLFSFILHPSCDARSRSSAIPSVSANCLTQRSLATKAP